jgi:hypothetical protein
MRSLHPLLRLSITLGCALVLMGQRNGPAPAKGAKGETQVPVTATSSDPPLPPLAVKLVFPRSAEPGEKVTIELNRNVNVHGVTIGDQEAEVRVNKGGILWVVVPQGLTPGEPAPIVIANPIKPVLYYEFTVLAPGRLEIIRVDPPKALPGTTVQLQLSRPLKDRLKSSVQFGARPAQFQAVERTIETIVPQDADTGDTTIDLYEGTTWTRKPFVILQPKWLGIPRSWLTVIFGSLVISGLLVVVAIMYVWARRRAARLIDRLDVIARFDETYPLEVEPDRPAPEVPEELVRLCASGKGILFAGPGLGAQSGLPSHQEALVQIVDRIDLPPLLKQQLKDALKAEELGFVSEAIESQVERKTLLDQLALCYSAEGAEISDAHEYLRELKFAGVLTSAWDHFVAKAFAKKGTVIISGEADAQQALRQDSHFIARLRGALDIPATVVFSSAEYQRTFFARPALARFVASQVIVHPLFFVGMSLAGLDEFFSAFRFPPQSIPRSFALVPYAPLWEMQQQRFRANYNVELIGYDRRNRHEQLVEFLRELEKLVGALPPEGDVQPGKLRRVRLENIGAFENLELTDLQDGWNIILGNNGAGKSTILRAIALGLCGDDPEAAIAGAYLLRHSARFGSIELQVGEVSYKTELRRVGNRVLTSAQFTLPQKGGPLTLGFPALRGISQRDPSGPSATWSTEPRVGDLLPLIRGTIDTRLDSLKQWLVNLVVNSTAGGGISNREAASNQARLRDFYQLLREFTPGQQVEPGRIDRQSWQVFVKTEDGDIPIDHLSQGMSSIFGWVGTLIQRMYEIPSSGRPTDQPALVLVDEIDAHLHPEWQMVLTTIVKQHFPNVQIVATTHSPLVVAGMKQAELRIASRDPAEPSRIDVVLCPIDPEGMRADQILTSPIFGLLSTRGPQTNDEMRRLSELALLKERNPDQEAKFQELRSKLAYVFRAGETRAARLQLVDEREKVVADLVRSTDEIAHGSEDVQAEMRRRLDELRREAE